MDNLIIGLISDIWKSVLGWRNNKPKLRLIINRSEYKTEEKNDFIFVDLTLKNLGSCPTTIEKIGIILNNTEKVSIFHQEFTLRGGSSSLQRRVLSRSF